MNLINLKNRSFYITNTLDCLDWWQSSYEVQRASQRPDQRIEPIPCGWQCGIHSMLPVPLVRILDLRVQTLVLFGLVLLNQGIDLVPVQWKLLPDRLIHVLVHWYELCCLNFFLVNIDHLILFRKFQGTHKEKIAVCSRSGETMPK